MKMMTKLITIPKFAESTGLSYRLCLHLVETGQISSVPVGRRRRIDVRWVAQWSAVGGYRQDAGHCHAAGSSHSVQPRGADHC